MVGGRRGAWLDPAAEEWKKWVPYDTGDATKPADLEEEWAKAEAGHGPARKNALFIEPSKAVFCQRWQYVYD